MREPWFWRSGSLAARSCAAALSPLSFLYDAGQRTRWALTKPATADVPVICIGNATLGGVGKTPFAMLTQRILKDAGVKAWFLTRGYGGTLSGPVLVSPDHHDADDVGDEALLLAKQGPAVASRNRPKGARMAAGGGAGAIVMDDGFQNPTLRKTLSILLIDDAGERSNGRVFPAGPFREPADRARMRADMVVRICRRKEDAAAPENADFAAWLEPEGGPPPQKVVAFTGIGVPSKFFLTLAKAGFEIAHKVPFPDHHRFTPHELKALERLAEKSGAALIATEKDFVRLPTDMRARVLTLPVAMRVNDVEGFSARLLKAVDAGKDPR